MVWFNGDAVAAGQFGPFADKATCEAVKKDFKIGTFDGTMRASCALSSINPALLPQVEARSAPKRVIEVQEANHR